MLSTSTFSDYSNGELITQPWNFEKIYIIGYSLGGMLVLRYSSYITLHSAEILFTRPALHYNPQYGCKEIGPEHYKSVKKSNRILIGWLLSRHGIILLKAKMKCHLNALVVLKKICIIYGKNDNYFDINSSPGS